MFNISIPCWIDSVVASAQSCSCSNATRVVDTAGGLVADPTEFDQSGIGSNRWKVATRGEMWVAGEGVESQIPTGAKELPSSPRKISGGCCFFRLLFLLNLPVLNETPAAKFRLTRKPRVWFSVVEWPGAIAGAQPSKNRT